MKTTWRTNFLLMITAMVYCSATVFAHPFHHSTSEIEWNGQRQCFEVAMNLPVADLEDALSVSLKRRVRLDDGDGCAKEIADYLHSHLQVTAAECSASQIRWIGREQELHSVWLYFEVYPKPSLQKPSVSAGEIFGTTAIGRSLPKNGTTNRESRPSAEPVTRWEDLFELNEAPTMAAAKQSADTSPEQVHRNAAPDQRPDHQSIAGSVPMTIGITCSVLAEVHPEQSHQFEVTIDGRTITHDLIIRPNGPNATQLVFAKTPLQRRTLMN